jgi:hypothetical protein
MENQLENEPSNGNNILLAAGQVVDTYLGWAGHITLIDESVFKYGQGVYIIRLDDQHCFSIGPNDVIMPPKCLDANVEHIRRQGFKIPKLVYFRKFNKRTKAESLHFCPAFVYALLAVVLFVKRFLSNG